jgi:putative glycosyltransferase (TIGR04372 family)
MYDTDIWPGKRPERPIKIFALISSQSFGDYASSLFYLNSVADRFDHAVVTLMIRNDMDFKVPLLSLLPVNYRIVMGAKDAFPGLDLLTLTQINKPAGALAEWYKGKLNEQDIVLTEMTCNSVNLASLDRHRYLAFPPELAKIYEEKLIALGVPRDQWFCTIHCREPGYANKPMGPNLRDGDPKAFEEATRYIIQELGGRVVRLGHPGMTKFQDIPGYFDLTAIQDPLLQAYAISRSRFLLLAPSGPGNISEAMGVPMAVVDAVDVWMSGPLSLLRTVDVIEPSGHVINQAEFEARKLSKLKIFALLQSGKGYQLRKCSASEIKRLTKRIFELTSDQAGGWRTPVPRWFADTVVSEERPNTFTVPTPHRTRNFFL